MDYLPHLVSSTERQAELLMSMSTAGMAAVLFLFLRSSGLVDGAQAMSRFGAISFLSTPLVCFLLAMLAGLFIVAQIQGFYTEVVLETSAFIENGSEAASHYEQDYQLILSIFMITQMLLSIVGYLFLVIWLLVNLYHTTSQKEK